MKAVVTGFRATGARVVVVDNGSWDGTGAAAIRAGAVVIVEPRRGYGSACLAGLAHVVHEPTEFVVFADCDGTLDPSDLGRLLEPLEAGRADLVIGTRSRPDPGALPLHQRGGNALVLSVVRRCFGTGLGDLSPFRAIRASILPQLRLRETGPGFPVETLTRALRLGLHVEGVDVAYRRRTAGHSKVAGSARGALIAAAVMVRTCLRVRLADRELAG